MKRFSILSFLLGTMSILVLGQTLQDRNTRDALNVLTTCMGVNECYLASGTSDSTFVILNADGENTKSYRYSCLAATQNIVLTLYYGLDTCDVHVLATSVIGEPSTVFNPGPPIDSVKIDRTSATIVRFLAVH